MGDNKKAILISIGLEASAKEFLDSVSSNVAVHDFKSEDFEKLMDAQFESVPALLVCGQDLKEISPYEVAQFLKSQFQESPIFFIAWQQTQFIKNDLLKNGVKECFTLPMDRDFLKDQFEEAMAKSSSLKSYRKVQILDLQPDSQLDFDLNVFLPMNNKFVRFSNAEEKLSEDRYKKLKTNQIRSIYVDRTQMEKFYEYTAHHLQKLGSSSQMSETERKQKIQESVRSLLLGVLGSTESTGTFDEGKALLADCQKIVNSYVTTTPQGEWYKQILATIDESGGLYSNTSKISTFAALFSLAIGVGKPEDLAMAGMLCDIGLTMIPEDILKKSDKERSPSETEAYRKHIDYTFDLIKKRKIVLSEKISKIIQQHHERFDGSGYPKGVLGNKILKEAQLLGIADDFSELIAVKPGRKRLGPLEVIEQMKKENASDPAKMKYDQDILIQLHKLFSEQER